MFKKLCALALVVAGCAAPTNKYSAIELSRDRREFTTATAQGGFKVGEAKVFGNVDLNSPYNRADTSDLTRFNERFRMVRPLYNGFGLTTEYKDLSGDDNNIGGAGLSYSGNGIEFRAYPVRTNGSREACLSFGKVFEEGLLDPYFRGFFDVGETDGKNYSLGEMQIGVKTDAGWRFFIKGKYSDFERRAGIKNPAVAFGLGLDF